MAGPFEAAGVAKDPTKYGALGMGGRELTGLYTNRSPYRDAAVPYLVAKFYGGSRFDSMWDGLNREIGAKLTDKRRPGTTQLSGTPALTGAAKSFYSFKSIGALTSTEICRLIADTAAGVVDATGGLNYQFFTKSAGAGKTRFLGSRTTLYFSDGPDQKKLLEPGPWVALTKVDPGTLINNQAYNESGQWMLMALGGITMNVIATSSDGTTTTVYIDPENVPTNFADLIGINVTFAGLTSATYLNGNTYAVTDIPSATLGIFTIAVVHASYPQAADTGTGNTGNGTTGSVQPTWTNTRFAVNADAGQQWKNYGTSLQNWGVEKPINAPTITAKNGTRFWSATKALTAPYAILDSNGDVEICLTSGTTGLTYPNWATQKVGVSFAIVSATQNANLAGSRSFLATANPFTTPPTGADVYQNKSGVAMLVTVSADLGGGGFAGAVYSDGNASPVTQVAQFARVNAGSSSPNFYPNAVTFLVPPNAYYGISVTNGSGTPTIRTWTEWLLNGASSTGPGSSTGSGAAGGPVQTVDNGVTWFNYGAPGSWQALTAFDGPWDPVAPVGVILDSNKNWQYVSAGGGGSSGSTEPTWASTIGATTTDGALTWTCLGPGVILTNATVKYGFSTAAIDGSVSTSSPLLIVNGPIVGPTPQAGLSLLELAGSFTPDTQLKEIWIWRTAQGQATPVLEDQIPIDNFYAGGAFTYEDQGVPDIPNNGSGALNALIAAPINGFNNPPVVGATGPVYHLGRVWMFQNNTVYWSDGPDALVGNGSTAWAPLNQVVYPWEIIKLRPITVQNGGMLVYTTGGMQIILGTGTPTNPFYSTVYCSTIILGNFDSEDVDGTLLYMMESNARVSRVTIEYPFNPQSGYEEIGFPIGDQFQKVTTGGFNSSLFNPKTAFVTWNRNSSTDTAMYVSDGAGHWFRMMTVQPPESGIIWSPIASIAGGASAVQSIETSPGVFELLLGPPAAGPILKRDTTGTIWTDTAALTAYPSWDAKGVTQLCTTGEQAEVAWIATKSAPVGARPVISLLMNEIYAGVNSPWNILQATSQDPATLPPSQTVFSDRYSASQSLSPTLGDCVLIKFDYGAQVAADELYDFQIYGSKHEERHQ